MNAIKTELPGLASALSEGRDLVGIALLTPPAPMIAVAAALFNYELETGLRRKGIDPTDNGSVFGPGFIVWTSITPDRNPMLRALEQVLKEGGHWANCEVAFLDKSEGYWRTIHPYGAPLFSRFLSMDTVRAAKEQSALDWGLADQALTVLRSILKGGETS